MDVLEIKGKVNTALCYAQVVEDEAIEQIRRMCDHDFTQGGCCAEGDNRRTGYGGSQNAVPQGCVSFY